MHLRNEYLVPAPFCRFSSGFVFTTLELGLCDTMIIHFGRVGMSGSISNCRSNVLSVLKSQKDSEEDNEVQVEAWRKLSSNSFVQFSGSVCAE